MWLDNATSTNWITILRIYRNNNQYCNQFSCIFFFYFLIEFVFEFFLTENFLFVENIFFLFESWNSSVALSIRMSSSFVWQWKPLKILNKKLYGITESINSTVKQKKFVIPVLSFYFVQNFVRLVLIWELKLPIGYATKVFFSQFTSGWRLLHQYQYCVKVIDILWKLTMFFRRRTSELLTRRHSLQ